MASGMSETLDERFEREKKYVGPGWLPVIEKLHQDLKQLAPDYELLQIKEKFGGLRYYASFNTETTSAENIAACRALVSAAESEAGALCEECGRPGRNYSSINGWWRTLCEADEAAAAQEERG